MEFTATMMFLGIKNRITQNGSGFNVTMYVPGGDAWDFYMKASPENNDVITYLLNCSSGRFVDVTFVVGKYNADNRLYLRIKSVEDAA